MAAGQHLGPAVNGPLFRVGNILPEEQLQVFEKSTSYCKPKAIIRPSFSPQTASCRANTSVALAPAAAEREGAYLQLLHDS
jgi:hypothetical protein